MTVKLLGPWGLQSAGTLYTTDTTTEAAMVAAKVATSDLTGGVVYVPPGGVTAPAASGATGGFIGAGNQAAMLAAAGASVVVGAWFLRTDVVPATNYYLDALPASSATNWRAGTPVDQNPPVASAVCLGGVIADGYAAIGVVTTMSRTANILTVNGTTPAGDNFVGQKVQLFGMLPYDIPGEYVKRSIGTNTFTVWCPGPDLTDGQITAATFRGFRTSSVRQGNTASPWTHAIALSDGRMRNLGNFSNLNETWANVGKRLQRDVLQLQPTRVTCMLGLYDLSTRLGGTASVDAQGVMDQASPVLLALIAAGVQIDLCSIEPTPLDLASHAAYNVRIPLVNALYAAFAAQYPDQVRYVDTYSVLVSDIGSGEQGVSANLVQASTGGALRANGALLVAQRLVAAWSAVGALGRRFMPQPPSVGDALRLGFNTNTAGGTAGTGASGTIPANWTIARQAGANALLVGSINLRADGNYDLQVDSTNSSGAATLRATYSLNLHTYMQPGSRWRLHFTYSQVNAGPLAGNLGPIDVRVTPTVDGTSPIIRLAYDNNALPTTGSQWVDHSARFISEEFQIPFGAACTAVTLGIDWFVAGASGLAGTMRIGDVELIKVGDAYDYSKPNQPIPTVASAATIAAPNSAFNVSGTTLISTITVPPQIAANGGTIMIIPTGLWSTNTAGNIALATTAVVNRALLMTWDPTSAKWSPSY
jgi:hypothetical protein